MSQIFCTTWISKKRRVCIIGLLKSLYYTKCSLYTHVLLVKRGVKTAKYWPSSFIRFFSSRSIKTQKRTGQYTCKSIFIQQAWSIKNLLYGQKKELFLAGNNAGNPETAWWAYLTCSGSQSECWIRFILPAHGFSHIIIGRKNRFKVSLTKDKILYWHEKHEQVVRTHWTSYQSSRPRVSGAYNPCTLSWIFTSKFGLSWSWSSLLIIHFHCGPNTCSHCVKVRHRTYSDIPICDALFSRSSRV